MSLASSLRPLHIVAALSALLAVSASCKPAKAPEVAPDTGPLAELPYSPALNVDDMDKTVDPCNDLYRYSCGGWLKANPIPADQSSWSVVAKATRDNERYLWGLVDDASKGGAARTPTQQKIGDYFAACMDEAAIEKKGAQPLAHDLAAIEALTDKAQIAELVGKMKLVMDSRFFFGFGTDQDYQDANKYIPAIGAGGLGLSDRDQYFKDDPKTKELRAKYEAHIGKMFVLMGEPAPKAAADAAAVMRIETALAKSSLTRTERRDPYKVHHKTDADAVQKLMPNFDWNKFLAAFGTPGLTSYDVEQPAFLQGFSAMLDATSLDDLKSYMRWHLARRWAPHLDSHFVEENFDFFKRTLRGVKEMQPRWRRCIQLIDDDLGEALGQVYVEKTFPPKLKEATVDMVKRVEIAMEQRIHELDWMSIPTKRRAIEKLHAMRNKIGYPDKWRDYTTYNVVRDDHLGNVARGDEFEVKRQFARLGKPVDRGEWDMNAPEVNAYYNPQMNDMNFPAGQLQPPFMDLALDAAPSFGDMGGTIGHELTHGFDDEGRQYDALGNLKDWWTEADAKAFNDRAQCVVDQYAQVVVVDDIHLNSKLTLGEDVADLGGEILAYRAWKDMTKSQKLESRDGMTPDQRFFVGFAQWVCGDIRPETKRVNALTNPHSPYDARINGVVVNMPEFAEAFSCKPGAALVKPKDKVCKIW